MSRKLISVAMAVYNGENYIEKQINSILCQLSSDDELVISYNDSDDNTLNIIKSYEEKDKRIKILICKEKGVISNFNNAINNCKNDIIFLSDQDDIWREDKVRKILECFEDENVLLILHNCSFIDDEDENIEGDLFIRRKVSKSFWKNLFKNSFQGSCMAFRKNAIQYFYPIPIDVPMHDQWITLCINEKNKYLLDEQLLKYRIHGNNVSFKKVNILTKINSIIKILFKIIKKRIFSR